MNRRTILASALAAALSRHAAAEASPYGMSLIGGTRLGNSWLVGVRIELAEGWKTYWRIPGDAGIPPAFTWNGGALADDRVQVLYPVPGRFNDAGGETIGYKHEVIFPVLVKMDGAGAMPLALDLFFAVCRDICIPARAKAKIGLDRMVLRDSKGAAKVQEWWVKVPVPGTVAQAADVVSSQGQLTLVLALNQTVADIFVEAASSAYFGAPIFSADGRQARLAIGNVTDAGKLKGGMLKLTFSRAGQGLEQTLILP